MEKIRKFISRYGWFGFARLVFYPITTLLITPIRLFQTLWSARALANGKWTEYNGFRVHNGLNSLFYRTQAQNFVWYGRSGYSPHLGLGNYPLEKWFHSSLPSLYAYAKAGAVLPLASMFGWWLMHFFWLESADLTWGLIVLTLALFSTKFFAGAFVYLNYNAMGWLFFPIGLWGILNEHYWIAGIAWLAASLGSFTVVVLA